MDPEKRARRQSLRIIVSESLMVLAVIVTVAILAFMVSGYWVNGDFKIERQGMLQISSLPTGADVLIDGETAWNQRTNTSKVLSSGEHTIELRKEGYDTWSRKVNIAEGLLYRVHYPRLFRNEREKQTVLDVSSVGFVTISPNREQALLTNNTTEWEILDLTRETLEPKLIDVSNVFTSISMAPNAEKGLFGGVIYSADWSSNNEKVLIKASVDDKYEWAVLDIKNPSNSANISKLFKADFSEISITDNSATNFLALLDGDLYKINLGSRQISAVLVEDVIDYDFYDSEILFSAKAESSKPDDSSKYYVGLLKDHGDAPEVIKYTSKKPSVTLSRFYDDFYIAILEETELSIFEKNDKKPFMDAVLSFTPTEFTVGHAGEFQTAVTDNSIATIDMEAKSVIEWQTESRFDWLDSDMVYTINDGDLIVYDFDGLNRRVIAKNVSSHFPVTVTGDKWLYYASDNQLIREKIAD